MYYTVIKHSGHLRTLEKRSVEFLNARRVLAQCNTLLRLLYLLNNESRKNLDSFSLSINVRDILNRICKTASKFEKKNVKINQRSSRSLEYAE